MEDRTAGQFNFALGVSKASTKAFEPRISRSNFYFYPEVVVSRSFLSQAVCKTSTGWCHYQPCPVLWGSAEFLNIYILDLDGLKTHCMTSVPSYQLYFLLKWIVQMGSVECIKPDNSTTFKPPSQNRRNTGGRVGCQIVSFYHPPFQ